MVPLTLNPNISGSSISQDNSDGTVLQDLTITLDSNGSNYDFVKFSEDIILKQNQILYLQKNWTGVIVVLHK